MKVRTLRNHLPIHANRKLAKAPNIHLESRQVAQRHSKSIHRCSGLRTPVAIERSAPVRLMNVLAAAEAYGFRFLCAFTTHER